MTAVLSEELGTYLDQLRSAYPEIREVWLIGSRANHSVHAGSDWDLIAFADEATCEAVEADSQWHRLDVDLLIVTDGNSFKRPWGRAKTGDLTKWEWHQVDPWSATYKGTKWPDDEEMWTEETLRAIRVR